MPLRGGFPLVAVGTLVFVVAYQGVGMLFIALLGNFRLSTSLAAVYAAPAFAFTGITFPIVGMDPFYRQAKVTVSGEKPGETIERVGASITYGITLLDKAPNREAAEAFLQYLFDPKGGLEILKSMGQPPIVPVVVPTRQMQKSMPAVLQPYVGVTQ